jgi:hypothetical protein
MKNSVFRSYHSVYLRRPVPNIGGGAVADLYAHNAIYKDTAIAQPPNTRAKTVL